MGEISSKIENPFAPPESSVAIEPVVNLLESACKCFRGMAWAGAIYPASTAARLPFLLITKRTIRTDDLELFLVQSLMMSLVAVFLVWIANRLRRDFDKTYKLARWAAIAAGTIFFPILTIPAVMAASRMAEFRRIQSGA